MLKRQRVKQELKKRNATPEEHIEAQIKIGVNPARAKKDVDVEVARGKIQAQTSATKKQVQDKIDALNETTTKSNLANVKTEANIHTLTTKYDTKVTGIKTEITTKINNLKDDTDKTNIASVKKSATNYDLENEFNKQFAQVKSKLQKKIDNIKANDVVNKINTLDTQAKNYGLGTNAATQKHNAAKTAETRKEVKDKIAALDEDTTKAHLENVEKEATASSLTSEYDAKVYDIKTEITKKIDNLKDDTDKTNIASVKKSATNYDLENEFDTRFNQVKGELQKKIKTIKATDDPSGISTLDTQAENYGLGANAATTKCDTLKAATMPELTQDEKDKVEVLSLFLQDVPKAEIFLSEHPTLKTNNPCDNASCINDYALDEIFLQESLVYSDNLKHKAATSLTLKECSNSEDYKISQGLHYVWLSSEQYTDQERKDKFWERNKYLKENIRNTDEWNHYLWTNNKDFIDTEIKNELQTMGVTIKTLEELGLDKEQHEKLAAASYQFAEQKSFGLATDIARYLVMFKQGGIYIDGDYKLVNVEGLEKIMCSYNSFFGVERGYDVRLGNGFLAAENNNKIIEEVINLSYRNIFDSDKSPEYVKSPCTNHMKAIHTTGPIPLSIAFADKQIPTEDLLLSYGYLSILESDISTLTHNNNFCNNLDTWETNQARQNTRSICDEIGDRLATQDFTRSWQMSGQPGYGIKYADDCAG